jgi:predicted acetyltransferase
MTSIWLESLGRTFLIEPSLTWQAAFQDMAAEFAASNDHRYQAAIDDFAAYLARRQEFACGSDLPPSYVPETTYWGVEGTSIVGGVRVRHHLTPALRQFGGHIGYDVRPSKRGQGCGTRLLALALERAWQLGLRQVLITCDSDNIGSARVIEKNGGKLGEQGMVAGYDKVVSRYWIERPSGD